MIFFQLFAKENADGAHGGGPRGEQEGKQRVEREKRADRADSLNGHSRDGG